MKTYWILTIALAAIASITAFAVAETSSATKPACGARGEHRKALVERWSKLGLNLTDDQKTQIKDIMTKARESSKAATDRKAKMQIRKDAFTQARGVLTPEQVQKLDEFKKEHPGMGRHGRHRGATTQPTI